MPPQIWYESDPLSGPHSYLSTGEVITRKKKRCLGSYRGTFGPDCYRMIGVLETHHLPDCDAFRSYRTVFTLMLRGLTSSALGNVSDSSPLRKVASTLSDWIVVGREMLRAMGPWYNS